MDLKNEICSKMYDFYRENKLCDLILIAKQDGMRIATHRVIVSATSEYFETMFTTSMKEKDAKEVPLGGVSGTMLKKLIEYCYTGQFRIDAENVHEALEAANMFRFVTLTAKCADYLKCHVDAQTCLNVWDTAELFQLHEVARTAFDYICEHFSDFMESDGFPLLKAKQLIAILNSDEIGVESEEGIFTAIIKWIAVDAENRRTEFEQFIPTIRMPELGYTFLVEHGLRLLTEIGCEGSFVNICNHVAMDKGKCIQRKRRNYTARNCIYAVSDSVIANEITIQCYKSKLNSWQIAYAFKENLIHFDVICCDNEMYLIGGSTNGVKTNRVRSLSLNTSNPQLKEIAAMEHGRSRSSSAVLFGFIYVTGGESSGRLVEKLNIKTMEWTEVPPMQHKRLGLSVAVLSGKLFATGGTNGSTALNDVEHYDPKLNSWTTVASMNVRRYGHRSVVVNNILYAMGGYNLGYSNSIEKYDELADKWALVTMELSVPQYLLGALVSKNCIIIGGGKSATGQQKGIEKINVETSERLALPSLPIASGKTHLVEGPYLAN